MADLLSAIAGMPRCALLLEVSDAFRLLDPSLVVVFMIPFDLRPQFTSFLLDLSLIPAHSPHPPHAQSPTDGPQRKYVDDKFLSHVLRLTRMGHNSRNASCRRLASLAHSLQVLEHKPDFGFMHNFTQSCRFMWTGFTPQVRGQGSHSEGG